jgi:hypothetical protein
MQRGLRDEETLAEAPGACGVRRARSWRVCSSYISEFSNRELRIHLWSQSEVGGPVLHLTPPYTWRRLWAQAVKTALPQAQLALSPRRPALVQCLSSSIRPASSTLQTHLNIAPPSHTWPASIMPSRHSMSSARSCRRSRWLVRT